MNPCLETKFGGLDLASPIVVGSGPATSCIDGIKKSKECGAGAVITKSIGIHGTTSLQDFDIRRYRYLRGYGFHLKSTYQKEILSLNDGVTLLRDSKSIDIPVIASVFYPSLSSDDDISEWRRLVKATYEAGASGIQLDFFYLDFRKLTFDRIAWVCSAIDRLCRDGDVPIFVKLNIGMDEDLIDSIAGSTHAAGLIFIDSINAEPYVDIWSRGKPIFDGKLRNATTGRAASVITGDPLLHFTLSMTQKLYGKSDKELLAGGGLSRWEDIVRCLMTGAQAVHVTSLIMYRGFSVIERINRQIRDFMACERYENINELIGISQCNSSRKLVEDIPTQANRTLIDLAKCNRCGVCEKIEVCNSFRKWPYEFSTNCDGCSLCISICPRKALTQNSL